MYLTTQRVRSASRGLVGINGALYLHGPAQPPTSTIKDLQHIVANELGQLTRTRTDVAPGGNDVQAFLDVVGRDDVDESILEGFLRAGAGQVQETTARYSEGELSLNFSCNLGLASTARPLFHELAQAAIALRASSAPQTSANIDIMIFESGDDLRFELEPASHELLRRTFPGTGIARTVSLPRDTAEHFRRVYRPALVA